nr:hypothetical protein [Tanacetum cinerariifolium]
MIELGLDIDEDILLRLEVKDLICCKGVCKSWYSLISSGCFVKSQLNNNVRNKVDNNEIGDTRITALTCTSMCCIDRRRECQVVGSSNGLVCISLNNKDFLIVNPSTCEVKELRNAPEAYCVSGFGFDSSIDDYKNQAMIMCLGMVSYVMGPFTGLPIEITRNSDGRRTKSKRQSHISSDSNDDGRRMERRRRERERSQSEREMTMTMRGDTGEK